MRPQLPLNDINFFYVFGMYIVHINLLLHGVSSQFDCNSSIRLDILGKCTFESFLKPFIFFSPFVLCQKHFWMCLAVDLVLNTIIEIGPMQLRTRESLIAQNIFSTKLNGESKLQMLWCCWFLYSAHIGSGLEWAEHIWRTLYVKTRIKMLNAIATSGENESSCWFSSSFHLNFNTSAIKTHNRFDFSLLLNRVLWYLLCDNDAKLFCYSCKKKYFVFTHFFHMQSVQSIVCSFHYALFTL